VAIWTFGIQAGLCHKDVRESLPTNVTWRK
jgi:hypothetical protein